MSSGPARSEGARDRLRAALRGLLLRPGHAVAVVGTLAVTVAVALPASLLLRMERWLPPLRVRSGLEAAGPELLDGIPWEAAARSPAALRSAELDGLVVLVVTLAAAVLLVCLLNLGVLVLHHLAGRRRELAIRRAVGATRSGLRAELLLECALLVGLGVTAGAAAAWPALGALPDLMPAVLSPVGGFSPRPLVALVLASPALAVVVVGYGVVGPAMTAGARPGGGGRRSVAGALRAGLGPARWEKALAALQCGLLVVLLAGSGMLIHGSSRPDAGTGSRVPAPGEVRVHELTLAAVSDDGSPDARSAAVVTRLSRQLAESIDADRAGVGSAGALLGLGTVGRILCRGCQRGPMAAPVTPIRPRVHAVGPGWLRTLDVRVLEGRRITADDRRGSTQVAMVNRAFAARYGAGAGEARLLLPGRRYGEPWVRVVGVVENLQPPGLGTPAVARPAVYLSALQHPPAEATVVVRGTDARSVLAGAGIAGVVRKTVGPLRPLTALLREHRTPEQRLPDAAGLLALLAWSTGLAGLASVTVLTLHRRWRELGIRRAVGARPRDVLELVLRDNLRTLGIGSAIGAVLATAEARALALHVPGLGGGAPALYYGLAVGALAATVLVTTWLPMRRSLALAPREMMARE